jgi:hypothetical protein
MALKRFATALGAREMKLCMTLMAVLSTMAIRLDAATAVSLCDLQNDPAAYDRTVVEVTAFVAHGFEDFTLFDPRCESKEPGVWLEYGGRMGSRTIYCCGVLAEKRRSEPLVVEDVPTTIVVDRTFQRFDDLIQRKPDAIAHATLRGRFFAGNKKQPFGGFGHFGMFDLLVIEQVLSVDPQDLRDIDYRAWSDPPDLPGKGCSSRAMDRLTYRDGLERQRQADEGSRGWSLEDPLRVAMEDFRRIAGDKPAVQFKQVQRKSGRVIFDGSAPDGATRYRIVVSRPYWLTFYAASPQKVAWVTNAIHESGCETK